MRRFGAVVLLGWALAACAPDGAGDEPTATPDVTAAPATARPAATPSEAVRTSTPAPAETPTDYDYDY